MLGLYSDLPPPSLESNKTSESALDPKYSPTLKPTKTGMSMGSTTLGPPASIRKSGLIPVPHKRSKTKRRQPPSPGISPSPSKRSNQVQQQALSSILSSISTPSLGLEDEYDPALPNDYEQYCQERQNQSHRQRSDDLDINALQSQKHKISSGFSQTPEGFSIPEPRVPVSKRSKLSTSKVILLTNMVGKGQIDSELENETASECQKYGHVIKCHIFQRQDPHALPDNAVRIFVYFNDFDSSKKAYDDLNGRYFGGRQVQASYYPEEQFSQGRYMTDIF